MLPTEEDRRGGMRGGEGKGHCPFHLTIGFRVVVEVLQGAEDLQETREEKGEVVRRYNQGDIL